MTQGRRAARPPAEPTVSAGFARGLMELAAAKGAPRSELLAAAGLTPDELQDQDARVPFAAYVALMRAGKALSGDAALALHYGEAVDISEVSIVGLIGQASATMLDAFRGLNRYVPLIVETENEDGGDRFRMKMLDGGAWLVDARTRPNDFPELTESAFAQLVCGPRRLGRGPNLLAAHFTHPDPGYRDEYERILRCPVTFEAAWNGMRIDPAWSAGEVQRLPRYAFGVLAEHADALLADLAKSKSVRGRVESLLMPVLHSGETGMDWVAEQMAVSRQTLFRRLKAEGVTFEQVLDELRHRLAADYLSARKVSVNETAYLTGFSEPAAFSRAFKRWTGVSPREWREGRGAKPPSPPRAA